MMQLSFFNQCVCTTGTMAERCRANKREVGYAWLMAEAERREVASQTGEEREAAWELYEDATAMHRRIEVCRSF
ncbi:hypothetical protein ABZ905_36745 [Streptomyces parvus]|uniref:hypothetical protein n=1 Tax=Streptomyces parvus TaxID=66428 RepID=UPI0033D036CF